jgi:hypothetical protein
MYRDSFGGSFTPSPIVLTYMCDSWRVAFMEKSVAQLNFTDIDQMLQIHGNYDIFQSELLVLLTT